MSWLTQSLFDLLVWLFDPARIVDYAARLVGQLFQLIALAFDEPAKTTLNNIATFFSSQPASKLYGVMLFCVSPLIDPKLLTVCLGVTVTVWFMSLIIKGIAYWIPVGGK